MATTVWAENIPKDSLSLGEQTKEFAKKLENKADLLDVKTLKS